jgi:hypothetical protein
MATSLVRYAHFLWCLIMLHCGNIVFRPASLLTTSAQVCCMRSLFAHNLSGKDFFPCFCGTRRPTNRDLYLML